MTTYWILLSILCSPLFFVIGRFFFSSWSDLADCIGYWLTPDRLSMFRGEMADDFFAELRLWGFVATCGLTVYGADRLFGTVLRPIVGV